MIIQDARRILDLMQQIGRLDIALAELADQSELARRLNSIEGFGKTCIAELAGEIGTMERFAGESSLALYVGMSPLNDDSGKYRGSKVPRQVNRRAKAAMMVAVVRHIDCVPESKVYYDKKRADGKKHNQAVRALGRHLVRVIWPACANGRQVDAQERTGLRTPGGESKCESRNLKIQAECSELVYFDVWVWGSEGSELVF